MTTIKYNATKNMNIQEKRKFLRELSAQASAWREQALHQTENDQQCQALNALKTNEILVEHFYKNEIHKEFKSFKGWIKAGKVVKEGESSFLVWGKPNERKADGTEQPIMEDEDGNKFYPLSFIFSNAQVQDLKNKKTA